MDPAGEESLGLFWNLNLNVNVTGLGMLQAANSFYAGVKISLIHTEAIFPKRSETYLVHSQSLPARGPKWVRSLSVQTHQKMKNQSVYK